MRIELKIPAARIADLFTSAIESGDPVTTASKGGWCAGVFWRTKEEDPPNGPWYADAAFYDADDFQVEVWEVADEMKYDPEQPDEVNLASGALKRHVVDRLRLARGLAMMADKFPLAFGEMLNDEVDAAAADAFLQSVVFGEEKYA